MTNVVQFPKAAGPSYELRRCTRLVGDLQAGRLMRWIASYHRKAQPKRGLEGLWNANPREAILAGAKITWKQYRRASAILTGLGAAEIEVHWYAGKRMIFTRPTEAFFVQFASGAKHWQDTAFYEKGHDTGHDEGHDQGTMKGTIEGTIIPSCSSCSSQPLDPIPNTPLPSGRGAHSGGNAAPAETEAYRALRIKEPSRCTHDDQFIRLAEDWLDRVDSAGGFDAGEAAECDRILERCIKIEDGGDPETGEDGRASKARRLREQASAMGQIFPGIEQEQPA